MQHKQQIKSRQRFSLFRRQATTVGTPATPACWTARLIPGAQETRSLEALTSGMSGLVLRKQAVALEMAAVATPQGVRRSFLIRAQTPEGGAHLRTQLLARYPQARLQVLEAAHDPLSCEPSEAVTCVDLRLGAPAYLPLRTWQPRRDEPGSDPLLGILSALKALPPRHRAVVQLVLTPAPATWSRKAQRFAQDHPLEEARFHRQLLARARQRSAATIEHEFFLEGLAILLVLVLLGAWLWQPLLPLLPRWLRQAGSQLLQGQMPSFSAGEIVQLSLGFVLLLALLAGLGWLLAIARNRLMGSWRAPTIYDPALVRQKTERIAYRATLRLYVMGPQPQSPRQLQRLMDAQDQRVQDLARRYQHTWRSAPWHQWVQWATYRRALTRGKQQVLDIGAWIGEHLRALRVLGLASWWRALPLRLQRKAQQGKAWGREHFLLWRSRRRAASMRWTPLERLIAAYHVYHLASGNFFVPRRRSARWARRRLTRLAHTARVLRQVGWRPAYLTPEEVASLYHLLDQTDLRDVAFLERGGARTRPVPWQLASGPGESFGENQHQGECAPVFFPRDILTVNLLAVAGTGKGKSSLFALLARFLFADAVVRASVLVDPHGDLAPVFLSYVPLARRDAVTYLNLADRANPPGLNFIDMSAGQDRDKTVDMLLSIFRKWWGDNAENKAWGARLENTIQYCLLTLCEVNRRRCLADPQNGPARQCTILSVVPLLQRPYYQKALLKEINDEDIWNWWKGYFARQEDDDQLQIAASVITRFSKFRASKVIRRIVGQPVSSISLTDIIMNGRLLIVNTASGVVGEDTATLIGSILLGLLQTCIAEQANRPEKERMPIYVFLDEMQKFTGVDLNAMLAELRKYGAHFALATQSFRYMDELDSTLTHTVLSNTDQLFAFDMSAQDAELMAREIGDGIEAEDILTLDNYACYARLSLAGARLPAFSLRLLPPPQGDPALVAALQKRSAQVYGRPAAAVDNQLRHQDRAGEQKRGPLASPSSTPAPDDDGLSPDFDSIDRDAQDREWPFEQDTQEKGER